MIIKKIISFSLSIAMLFSLTAVAFAYEVCNYPEKNKSTIREECIVSTESSIGPEDGIMGNKYTTKYIYMNTKTYTGWYNKGNYGNSTKMALGITVAKYNVVRENIGNGHQTHMYYEYRVTYYWYTRKNTSQSWTFHGQKHGTYRDILRCPEDCFWGL